VPKYDLSSAQLAQVGPITQVTVGPSAIYANALRAAGRQVPGDMGAAALVDTGAAGVAITRSLARSMGLSQIDTQKVLTPSTPTAVERPVYAISLAFTKGPVIRHIVAVDVDLDAQGIQLLLGRRLLTIARLVYDGTASTCTLSFR